MAIEIALPTLHVDQARAFHHIRTHRFSAIRCGRRWGKTKLAVTLACDRAVKRRNVGWFAPEYRFLAESYAAVKDCLAPVMRSSSKTEGAIRLTTGGLIDFWSLDNDIAGRGRFYDLVIIDEAAFTRPGFLQTWDTAIKPTLYDRNGSAVALSNTNGDDSDNFFWQLCNNPELEFHDFHAPTMANPLLPKRKRGETEEEHAARRREAHEALRTKNPPLIYQQEHLAEFVNLKGVSFFDEGSLLIDGQPAPWPKKCDAVYAVIDSASKTGRGNDGTAVVYFARDSIAGIPLLVIDYDIVQIEGALLETWLPGVLRNLQAYGKSCGARHGSAGAWIEDKDSGIILLQQAARKGWPVQAIDSRLTALGKDERALNAAPAVYRGEVKITQAPYDKIVTFKGDSRNQLLWQLRNFRIGDKDAAKRADDLLDAFSYGVEIGLGVRGQQGDVY